MDPDGKRDGRSIEEILASIRRIFAEAERDPLGTTASDLANFEDVAKALDPEGDFELPAIYRGPLRGSVDLPPPSDNQPDQTPEQAETSASEPWVEALTAATRALEAIQGATAGYGQTLPLPPPAPTAESPAPAPSSSQSESIPEIVVPRTMSHVKDTVIGRMGQTRRAPDDLSPTALRPEISTATASFAPPQIPAPTQSQAAAAPQTTDSPLSTRARDSAAEAIRPLVMEWLDSNMRLILEKALRDELKKKQE